MTLQELRETIDAANNLVESMPEWKKYFLVVSAEAENKTPRIPVTHRSSPDADKPVESVIQ